MLFFPCWRRQHGVEFSLITTTCVTIVLLLILTQEVNSHRHDDDHGSGGSTRTSDHRLVVISLDGFRWDYLHGRAVTPTFDAIKRKGVHAREGVQSVFLTNTLPNHMSIATGLYVESHGMMDNIVHDPEMNDTYVSVFYHHDATHDPAWYKSIVEPVWISHQIQNDGTTGVLMWMGGEMVFQGVRAHKFFQHDYTMDEIDEMDVLLDWLTDDDDNDDDDDEEEEEEPVDFAMVYFPQPDFDGHMYGPESVQVTRKIECLDKALGHLIRRLEELGLSDSTDVMLVSDHGFTSTTRDRVIQLDDIVDRAWYKTFTMLPGTSVSIFPTEGMMDKVYDVLKSHADKTGWFNVYRSRDIPERFHFKSHQRVPPIFALATLGYSFARRDVFEKMYTLHGNHGYDNQHKEMRPFFMAFGPSFLEGVSVETFEIVDVYPLMCHIKGIQPHPNNGSMAIVSKLLRHYPINQSHASTGSCDTNIYDGDRSSDGSCPGRYVDDERPVT